MPELHFKVDENLPVEVADALRDAGFVADTVWDEGLSGASDDEIAKICVHEQRALITVDLDFADIRAYPPDAFYGIIVLRLRQQDKERVINLVKKILPLLRTEELAGHLWIIEEKRVRIR